MTATMAMKIMVMVTMFSLLSFKECSCFLPSLLVA